MKKTGLMLVAGLAGIATAFADGSISGVGAENGGSAAVSLSSATTSDIDLYDGLLFWIKDQNSIEGDKERKTTYPLSKVFDGSFSNPLAGTAIPAKDENDYTLSLSFKVGKLNRVNRLFKIGGHTIYLDENNILYYHTLKTDFVVDSTEQYYTLVLRVAGDRRLTVYAGAKGSKLYVVWSGLITGQLTFGGALAMNAFNLGYGEKPSAGYLQSGQFANIRFWTRTLTDGECERVDIWQKPDITVSDVEVFSGCPWQEVAIAYTITGTSSEPRGLALDVTDKDTGKRYEGVFKDEAAAMLVKNMSEGRHVSRWLIHTDDNTFKSSKAVFTLRVVPYRTVYCIIDLSKGSGAAKYPVWYCCRNNIEDWTDEYKTTKLVLRRIENEPTNELKIRQFYIGVFEMTQKQYELVMGTNPSSSKGAKRPVEYVSYDMIRGSSLGAGWPKSNAVDATSLLGRLRAKTGLRIDLPTCEQWLYACQSGTTTTYSYGDKVNGDYMWYAGNSSLVHDVGTKLPNSWGLYDMLGNVWEWCLDLVSGQFHPLKGGSWSADAGVCSSHGALGALPGQGSGGLNGSASGYGFRLAMTF